MEWLEYPSEFRIMHEESGDKSNPNIMIGSDKDDPTYTKWVVTFVINREDEFFMVDNVKFYWDDVEDYPKTAPTFHMGDFPEEHRYKVLNLFDDQTSRLKVWDPEKTIRQNFAQIYNAL